jgi:hypothetical protein
MAKPYSPPKLDPKVAAAVKRGDFDYLMPFSKNLLRAREVSEVISRSVQFVRALIEDGRLEAHLDSVWGDRESPRITNRSVILYLAETANYDPSFLVIRLEVLMKKLDGASLDRLIESARKVRSRIH